MSRSACAHGEGVRTENSQAGAFDFCQVCICFSLELISNTLSTIDHGEIAYVNSGQTYVFLCVPFKNSNSTVNYCALFSKGFLPAVSMVDERTSDWCLQHRHLEALPTKLQRDVHCFEEHFHNCTACLYFSERDSLIAACVHSQPSTFELTTETGQPVLVLHKVQHSYDHALLNCKS